MEGMISISTSDIKDEYSVTGKDPFNQGYWWQENMSYSISIESKSNLYKNPVKLEFHTRYNKKLDSSSNFNGSSLESDGHVDDVSRIILQNSQNTNQVVYFDKLNSNPTASQNGTTDMIQISNFTNKINGVPNLYRISNSYGYDISLNYKLENYSEYYGLNPSVNFVSHTFTTISKADVAPRNWVSKSQCTRDPSGWTIADLPINETTNGLGDVSSNTTSNVQIQLNMENMDGSFNHTIGTSDSTIHKFIYDKKSVDLVNQSGINIMDVPNNFNPEYNTNYAKSVSTYSNFTGIGNTINNNQLNLWNGYFYSRNGWQTATSINKNNCLPYGMPNTLPVFHGTDNDYKYVIFKYTRTMPDGNADRIICALKGSNSSNDPEVSINDLRNDDVSVYLYTGTAMTNHYWLNISKGDTSLTLSQANSQQITYAGSLADGIYASGSQGINNATFIASSGLPTAFTNATSLGGNLPKRAICAYINRIDFDENDQLTFYVAIRINNNINKRVEKPDLWLSGDNTQQKTYKFD